MTMCVEERLSDLENDLRATREALRARAVGGAIGARAVKSWEPNVRKIGRSPWKTAGHFYKAVKDVAVKGGHWAQSDDMRTYANWMTKALPLGMNELQGQDGGFLVPPEYAQQLLMRTYENDLLSRVTTLPTTSNLLNIPAVNETSRADGSRFGGVLAYWRGEGDPGTTVKPSLEMVELKPQSLMLLVRVTNELLEDASVVSLEHYVSMIAEQELAFRIGDAIVNGNGTTKPLGIFNAPAKVTVPKESGQASQTVVAQNVIRMWSRLHSGCRPNAVWLYDQSIEPMLHTMTVGSAGSQLAVYLPPGGLSASPYGSIYGRPAIAVEFCKPLGTEGDLILWDPTTYLVAMRQTMEAASSIHVQFLSNESVFRFTARLDGKAWWTSALQPKSGGPTQSCILTLQGR